MRPCPFGRRQVARQEQRKRSEDDRKDRESIELVVTGACRGARSQAEAAGPAGTIPALIQGRRPVHGAREVLVALKKQKTAPSRRRAGETIDTGGDWAGEGEGGGKGGGGG